MPNEDTAGSWRGHELVDRDGERIGKIADVYRDRHTDEPTWVTVKTGLVGTKVSVVPIGESLSEGGIVRVPYEKGHVLDAPGIDPDDELSPDDERSLYDHYGIQPGAS